MIRPISRTAVLLGLLSALPVLAEEAASSASAPDKPLQNAGGTERRSVLSGVAEIADPTRISESFRQALERRMPAKTLPSNEAAKAAPVAKLPQISLAASVCGHHKDMMHAMLRINGKVELVRPGDKLTVIDKDGLIGIEVLEIQRSHVHVRVVSDALNEELVLH